MTPELAGPITVYALAVLGVILAVAALLLARDARRR